MLFLTVGTLFPFDRLVKSVDDFISQNGFEEEVFGQIGDSLYKPRNFESAKLLDKKIYDNYLKNASAVISHAGMGTIMMTLENKKPMLAMPRLKRYMEHINDHQVGTAKKFSEMGHILVAYDTDELPERIWQLKTFVPKERKANPEAVADRIRRFLETLQITKSI